MTFAHGLAVIADLVFVGVFLSVLITAIRTRRRASIDAALFFGAGTIAVAIAVVPFGAPILDRVQVVALVAMPALLLRVVGDFAAVPRRLSRLSIAGFILTSLAAVLTSPPYPGAVLLLIVGYVVVVNVYATWRFAARARLAHGSRRRRKQAVALGTLLLACLFVIGALRATLPAYAEAWAIISGLCSVGCTVGYFLGFAPPKVFRRGWQHGDLISAIGRLNEASTASTFPELIRRLQDAVATALGAPSVVIALWDADDGRLTAPGMGFGRGLPPERANSTVASRGFRDRLPIFVDDAGEADPENRDVYERLRITTLLTAPLIAGDQTIGVVSLFGDNPPLFADDDLATLVALSTPIATVIRNWELTEQRTAAAAYEESLALEREFLSAAAHELRTPLTSILGESQLLLRRLQPDTTDHAVESAHRITGQATRMRGLVNDLLNVARDSRSGFVEQREPADVLDIVREVAADFPEVAIDGQPAVASVDPIRLSQVVRHVFDNARKYSPPDSPVDVRVRGGGGEVLIAVRDQGIGVPLAERERIFERFVRGVPPEGRHTDGIGLGLYLCRRIVEEHGGRIWVESGRGRGSTFFVALPALPAASQPSAAEQAAVGFA